MPQKLCNKNKHLKTGRSLQRLYDLIETGPLEAGFTCGVWTSSMIAVLIEREFGVTYNPRYVCQLLHKIGITYQQAAFVSAKWDDEGPRSSDRPLSATPDN